jgi:phosphate transport system protein
LTPPPGGPTHIKLETAPIAMHILGSFDEALGNLRNDVLMMASLTERNLERAFRGLFERDEELCNLVIADDEEIDTLEKQVDKGGIDLLMRFQPVAIDLRSIIAAMKLSANLERIADQATGIARRARRLNQTPLIVESQLIERMTSDVTGMLKDSLRAFTDGDLELAATIKPRDRQLDQTNAEINQQFTDLAQKEPANIQGYLDLIFIARNIERIGDHATNIAEDAIYVKAAQDVRHVKAETAG